MGPLTVLTEIAVVSLTSTLLIAAIVVSSLAVGLLLLQPLRLAERSTASLAEGLRQGAVWVQGRWRGADREAAAWSDRLVGASLPRFRLHSVLDSTFAAIVFAASSGAALVLLLSAAPLLGLGRSGVDPASHPAAFMLIVAMLLLSFSLAWHDFGEGGTGVRVTAVITMLFATAALVFTAAQRGVDVMIQIVNVANESAAGPGGEVAPPPPLLTDLRSGLIVPIYFAIEVTAAAGAILAHRGLAAVLLLVLWTKAQLLRAGLGVAALGALAVVGATWLVAACVTRAVALFLVWPETLLAWLDRFARFRMLFPKHDRDPLASAVLAVERVEGLLLPEAPHAIAPRRRRIARLPQHPPVSPVHPTDI